MVVKQVSFGMCGKKNGAMQVKYLEEEKAGSV